MTPSRYYVARFTQAFGYFRRNIRMADAASEMHLLREAEAQLGAAIWEKVQNIEELSVEYWNLRKFLKEREIVRERLAECQAQLEQAHANRVEILNNNAELNPELVEQRITLLTQLEAMSIRREEIVAEARDVRRSYEGHKMKLEVLTAETSGSEAHLKELGDVKSRLAELKIKFADLKEQRVQIAEQIRTADAEVDLVDAQLSEKLMDRRAHASEASQRIGDSNKDMASLRAESGVLDTQMRQLYAEIGRFVSRRSEQHQGCADAAVDHRNLIEVMRALRRSIALNHRLAGTA
jgi:chromosome segregation ATPase